MFQHIATHFSSCRIHHTVCSSPWPHILRLVVSIIQYVPAHGHTFFFLSCPSYSMFQHMATHSSLCRVYHTVCSSTWPHILRLVVSITQYVPEHGHTFFILSGPSYSMFQHMATHSSSCRVHHIVCSSTWPHILHLVVSIIQYVPAHGHTFFILSCPSYSMFQTWPHILHRVHHTVFFILSCPSYSMFQHMATHSSSCRVHHTVCSSTWPHILHLVVSIIQYVPAHGHTFFILSCPSYSMFQHIATHSSSCRVHHTVCSSPWPHILHLVVSIIQYVPAHGHTFFNLSCPSHSMFQHIDTHYSSCRVHHTVCSRPWPHILHLVVSIIQYVPAHGHTFFTLSCPSHSMFQPMATHSSSCRVHHTVCSSTWPHILHLVVSIIHYVPAHGHTFFILSCPSYSMFQHMATHSSPFRVHHIVCSSPWPHILRLVLSIIQYVPAHGHTFFFLSCPSYSMFQHMVTHSSHCRVYHTVCSSTWPHILRLVVSITQYVQEHGHTFFILSCPSYNMFQHMATHSSPCRVHHTVCSSTWPHILHLVVSMIQYVPAHDHTFSILSCPSYSIFQHMAAHSSSCRVHHTLCSSTWPHIQRLVVSIIQYVPALGHTFFVLSCPSYIMFQHMATHSSSCRVHHTVCSSTWPHILHLVVSIIQYVPAHGHAFFILSYPSYSMFQHMATHFSSCLVHHILCSSPWPHILRLVVYIIQYVPAHGHTFFILSCPSYSMFQHMVTHFSSCRVHHILCSSP